MRPVWMLTVAGLGLVGGFMLWVWSRSGDMGGYAGRSWTGGSPHILAAMLIGALGSGALAGGLIWLAFFSARRGYDDRADAWEDVADAPGSGDADGRD